MTSFSSKLQVHSHKAVPYLVAVEPWGADYTLLPGESLQVVAFGDEVAPSFELVEWNNSCQVYCDDASSYEVRQNGAVIHCGHNRQPDRRASSP